MSAFKNCSVISNLTESPTKTNLKRAKGWIRERVMVAGRPQRKPTPRDPERGAAWVSKCVRSHFFIYQPFPFWEKDRRMSPAELRTSELKERLKSLQWHTWTPLDCCRALAHANTRLCCRWMGVDYRSVILFLLLSVPPFFDVGKNVNRSYSVWEKQPGRSAINCYTFLNTWKKIKMNSPDTIIQCMDKKIVIIHTHEPMLIRSGQIRHFLA